VLAAPQQPEHKRVAAGNQFPGICRAPRPPPGFVKVIVERMQRLNTAALLRFRHSPEIPPWEHWTGKQKRLISWHCQ